VDRYATADAEVGGTRIRAGDLVVVSLSAAGRDPGVFADPDGTTSTGTTRRPPRFAVGPHYCLGVHLTTLQTTLAPRHAARPLPRHPRGGPLPPVTGFVFRKPVSVPVSLGS
jgi:cytochrome P450